MRLRIFVLLARRRFLLFSCWVLVLSLVIVQQGVVKANGDDNNNGDGGGLFSTNCPVAGLATCVECVANDCGWIQTGSCLRDCQYVADIPCYSQKTVGPLPTPEDVCNVLEQRLEDQAACGAATNAGCPACIATALPSDATSFCQWYSITNSCGTGACNQLGCGETACSGDDDGDGTTAIDNGGGGAGALLPSCSNATACDACLALDCAWADGTGQCLASCSEIAGDAGCYSREFFEGTTAAEICAMAACYSAATCDACLALECAWSETGQCLYSCSEIADAGCYSREFFDEGTTAAEICAMAAADESDQQLCAGAVAGADCEACTGTLQSDGESPCVWYVDDGGTSWCDSETCNGFGVCGTVDCNTIIADPTPTTAEPSTGSTEGAAPTGEPVAPTTVAPIPGATDEPPPTPSPMSAADDSKLLPIGSQCFADSDCESGVCYFSEASQDYCVCNDETNAGCEVDGEVCTYDPDTAGAGGVPPFCSSEISLPSPTDSPAAATNSSSSTSPTLFPTPETIVDLPPSTSFPRTAASSSILLLSVGLLALII